jgi:hypothetical protein
VSPELVVPRTNADILRDLLDRVKENEWVEQYTRCGRGCCGDWTTECPSCKVEQGDDYRSETYRQHKPGCQLAALILEAETYLSVEEKLEAEREAAEDGR